MPSITERCTLHPRFYFSSCGLRRFPSASWSRRGVSDAREMGWQSGHSFRWLYWCRRFWSHWKDVSAWMERSCFLYSWLRGLIYGHNRWPHSCFRRGLLSGNPQDGFQWFSRTKTRLVHVELAFSSFGRQQKNRLIFIRRPSSFQRVSFDSLFCYFNHFFMKSNSDGHFPYGVQPSYRDFLMPAELETSFREVAWTGLAHNPLVVARYFYPAWAATWYATEYDPDSEIFYGFATGLGFPEWGSFSLREWIDFEGTLGLKIERDLWFYPQLFEDAVPKSEREMS